MASRIGIATGVVAGVGIVTLGIMALLGIGSVIAIDVLDMHPTAEFNRGLNVLFEDGSFIVSTGAFSVAGCLPFNLCSIIGVDSP